MAGSGKTKRARELRRRQTDVELLLWLLLRDRRLAGFKFRRQRPVGSYVVDFVCLSCGLVVELDGGQHADRLRHDEARSRYLAESGFRVLRFWNNEVLERREAVLAVIVQACADRPHPHPLPPAGEGDPGWST